MQKVTIVIKKAVLPVIALFFAISAFAYEAKEKPLPRIEKDTTAPSTTLIAPVITRQFVLVLNEQQLGQLYDFIKNADIYSDKGRLLYLQALDKMIVPMPAIADTSRKK